MWFTFFCMYLLQLGHSLNAKSSTVRKQKRKSARCTESTAVVTKWLDATNIQICKFGFRRNSLSRKIKTRRCHTSSRGPQHCCRFSRGANRSAALSFYKSITLGYIIVSTITYVIDVTLSHQPYLLSHQFT